jgi:hypothetical protein
VGRKYRDNKSRACSTSFALGIIAQTSFLTRPDGREPTRCDRTDQDRRCEENWSHKGFLSIAEAEVKFVSTRHRKTRVRLGRGSRGDYSQKDRTPRHSPFDFAPATAGKQDRLIGGYKNDTIASCYRVAIRDSRIAVTSANKTVWRARHEWLFRLRFAQSRVTQLPQAA